jgi:hypothetical protein
MKLPAFILILMLLTGITPKEETETQPEKLSRAKLEIESDRMQRNRIMWQAEQQRFKKDSTDRIIEKLR